MPLTCWPMVSRTLPHSTETAVTVSTPQRKRLMFLKLRELPEATPQTGTGDDSGTGFCHCGPAKPVVAPPFTGPSCKGLSTGEVGSSGGAGWGNTAPEEVGGGGHHCSEQPPSPSAGVAFTPTPHKLINKPGTRTRKKKVSDFL